MVDRQALHALGQDYLDQLPGHVEDIMDRLRVAIPEYRIISPSDARASTTAIIGTVVTQLIDMDIDAQQIRPLSELARRRAERGFPPHAVTRSIQLGTRYVLTEIDRIAARIGTDPITVLWMHDSAWQFAADAAAVVADIHHDVAVNAARREVGRRTDFLRGVLHGTIAVERISAEASIHGLDPAAEYFPVCMRPADAEEEARLFRLLNQVCATSTLRPVLAVIQGDLVGVVPRKPVIEHPGVIAVGSPAPLCMLAGPFRAAISALRTAEVFDRTGVITLADLGPLPLTLTGDDLAEAVKERHFGELDDGAEIIHDIQRTVWSWLQADQSVDDVAAKLHVHPNTVRYRLGRFRTLTGLDGRKTDDLVLMWWMLGRRLGERKF